MRRRCSVAKRPRFEAAFGAEEEDVAVERDIVDGAGLRHSLSMI